MGACCVTEEQQSNPNSVIFGKITVKVTTSLPPSIDSLVIVTNTSMELDPYEEKLNTKQAKEKHIISKELLKNGQVIQLKINKEGVRQVLYISFPSKDNSLVEFKIHQSITRAIQTAFEYDTNVRLGFSVPAFAELGIDQKVYQNKISNAIRLFSIQGKGGCIYLQVPQQRVNHMLKELRRKTFQHGQCDQQ